MTESSVPSGLAALYLASVHAEPDSAEQQRTSAQLAQLVLLRAIDEPRSLWLFASTAMQELSGKIGTSDLQALIRDAALLANEDDRSRLPLKVAQVDLNRAIRTMAVWMMARSSEPEAADALCVALREETPAVRTIAVRALSRRKHAPAVRVLNAMTMRDSDAEVRLEALRAVASIGDKSSAQILRSLLVNGHPRLPAGAARYLASEGLGRMKDARAVSLLITALHSDDNVLRAHAIRTLGVIGDAFAIPALAPFLVMVDSVSLMTLEGKMQEVSYATLTREALLALGRENLVNAFEVLLRGESTSLPDLTDEQRKLVIEGLMRALESVSTKTIDNAARALCGLNAFEAMPRLKEIAMRNRNSKHIWEVCTRAYTSLKKLSQLPRAAGPASMDSQTLPRIPDATAGRTDLLPRAPR